jgi:hypothetical protein
VRRFKVIAGELRIEPDLPPGFTCGGLESPYLPQLTDEELRAALALAGLVIEELAGLQAELDRRARRAAEPCRSESVSSEPEPPLSWNELEESLDPERVKRALRAEARAERETADLIDRLRER